MSDYYAQVHGNYGQGSRWSFGLHITSNQALASLLTTWANAWGNAWTNGTYGLETIYPTTTEIDQYTVALLDANYRQTQKAVATVAAAGTSTDDTLPFQEAVCISLRTAMIGRHARGRFYLPALAETAVNGDVLTPAVMTRVSSAVKSVQASIIADGSTVFVVHKPTVNPPTVAGPKYVVTDFLVSNKPARQSRRVRKIRPTYL